MTEHTKHTHLGNNAKRIREILGIKQEAIASTLGISQQAVSQLEGKESLDEPTLEKIASAMNVSREAIENFSEEAAVNVVSNTFNSHDQSTAIASAYNSSFSFNPIEKIIELYERLLVIEKEKNELLKQLNEKKD